MLEELEEYIWSVMQKGTNSIPAVPVGCAQASDAIQGFVWLGLPSLSSLHLDHTYSG